MDVVNLFRGLTYGQQHNLDRAVRAFFNFHQEVLGVDEGFLNALRRAIPMEVEGVDLTIPSEKEVVSSLRRLRRAPLKYQGFYSLLLDSGLRITEAARLINNFQKPEKVSGFYRCKIGYFRGSKCAYFAYFTTHTFNLIRKIYCGFRGDSPDAWCTNEWNGAFPGGSGEVWHYKIIWVEPELENSLYWREGGYSIWGSV